MAKKANGTPPRNPPEFKELDAAALLGRLKNMSIGLKIPIYDEADLSRDLPFLSFLWI